MQKNEPDRTFMTKGIIRGSLLAVIGVCLILYLILTPMSAEWVAVTIFVAAVTLCAGAVIIAVHLIMLFEVLKAKFISAIVQAQAAGLQYESVEVRQAEEEIAKDLKKPCRPYAIEVFSVTMDGTLLVATRDMWYFLRDPGLPKDEIIARRLPKGLANLKKLTEA